MNNKTKRIWINAINFIIILFLYIFAIYQINTKETKIITFVLYLVAILGIWKLRDIMYNISKYAKVYIEYNNNSVAKAIVLAIGFYLNKQKGQDNQITAEEYKIVDMTQIDYELYTSEYRKWVKFKKMYEKLGDR